MLYIFLAILIFGILIGLHELGHFLAAKACGVQVNEFSIGMGPLIFQRSRGETDYSLRLFPIGGYCAMEGEEEASDNPRALNRQGFWKQLIIFAAGAAMNFLTGFLILLCLYAGSDAFYKTDIVGFNPAFPQQGEDGLLIGDEIYAINGERIYLRGDVSTLLSLRPQDTSMELTIRRNGSKLTRTLEKRMYTSEDGEEYYGYGFYHGGVVEATPLLKLQYSWYHALDYVRLVRLSLQMLLSGDAGVSDLSGPVGIVSTISEMGQETEAEEGIAAALENVFFFGALIAVNLAVMNLLPLPALDGGKILILILNTLGAMLFRKRIPAKLETAVNAVGFVLLMCLMLFVTFHDVTKLF